MPPKKPVVVAKAPAKAEKKTFKQIHAQLNPKELKQYNSLYSIIDNRKFDDMITICDQLLKTAPDHCELLAFKGFAVYYKENDDISHKNGLQLMKQAAQIADRQSHIPYQLYANVLKQLKEFKLALNQIQEILAIPNWQNAYTFNRDAAIVLFNLGEYKQSFEQFKLAHQTSDKENKEQMEAGMIMLGIMGSKKTQLVAKDQFDTYIAKQMKTRTHAMYVAEMNHKADEAYFVSKSELNQLTLYRAFFDTMHMEPAEQITYYETLLQDKNLLDKPYVHAQIVNLLIDTKSENAALLMSSLKYLLNDNPDDSELIVKAFTHLKSSTPVEELIALLPAHQMPIIRQQIIYTLTQANMDELIKQYSALQNAACLSMLESFLGEAFNAKLVQEKATGLLQKLAAFKYSAQNLSNFEINIFFLNEQLTEEMNQLEQDLVKYDEVRTELNSVRKEDEKVKINLPDVPELKTNQKTLNEKRNVMIQEALALENIATDKKKIQLARLAMLLDPRDRFLNVTYARELAATGDIKKSMSVYQKFVARNNAMLSMIDNQEMNIACAFALHETSEGETSLLNEQVTAENRMHTFKIAQLAVLMELMKVFEEQRWDVADQFYQVNLRQQRATYIKTCHNFNKMLIQRPIVNKLVRKLETLVKEFKGAEYSEEYAKKYDELYNTMFTQHCKFDGEYKRLKEDDFFCGNFLKNLKNEKPEMPKRVAAFLKKSEEFGVAKFVIE
ncbi:Conserved_hypothetical protein [Hexamita inflata]|uniref:Uncharacterized protein n=1 Tax=Hexamita inflata TaxID=28002 RepID=A0AA86TX97_9EUKA|nr:Conserved hypothetical protein [Hexamita inflata]